MGQKDVYSCGYTKRFILVLLIVLFSIVTTVNLLLPTPSLVCTRCLSIFVWETQTFEGIEMMGVIEVSTNFAYCFKLLFFKANQTPF